MWTLFVSGSPLDSLPGANALASTRTVAGTAAIRTAFGRMLA